MLGPRLPRPVFQAFKEMFTGPKEVKVDPVPTRNDAADQVNRDEEDRKKRAAVLSGMASTMLTGSSGVPAELTGTRGAGGG